MPIKPRNPNNVRSTTLGAAHEDHEHAHGDLTGVTSDQHHAEAHSVASHNDTTATGAELETLTDGSDADSLHTHGSFGTPLTEEEVEDFVGGMLIGNTETRITVTYEDVDGTIDFVVDADLSNYTNTPGWIADITGSPLSELQDVTITSIASGEILKWNGTAWINQTLAEAGIAADVHTHIESDVTDLDHPHELVDLSDVNTSTPTNRNVLVADGVDWESRALVEADISDLDHYDSTDFATDVGTTDAADHTSGAATDGHVLTADGIGGAAWEANASGGLDNIVEDTTPQLGGNLDTNGFLIDMDDDKVIRFGTDNDASMAYAAIPDELQVAGPDIQMSASGELTWISTTVVVNVGGDVGASGEALMSDGAGKVVWATPSGGGGGDAGLQDILMLGGM